MFDDVVSSPYPPCALVCETVSGTGFSSVLPVLYLFVNLAKRAFLVVMQAKKLELAGFRIGAREILCVRCHTRENWD